MDVVLNFLGLSSFEVIPWLDVLGLFLLLAGFIIGLGAVTVIDMHGFLARKSSYWTEATIRSHKVTKPLIWLGVILAFVGGLVFYRQAELVGITLVHLILLVILIINGIFLSFRVSPFLLKREALGKSGELLPKSWQISIFISFIVSFVCWWSALLLLVLYILLIYA